jgi:thiosulfate/3-mercaptopyruvate sulfurtransferase
MGTEEEGLGMNMQNDPLVSTEWLAEHLKDAKVKLLDATFKLPGMLPLPKDDYLAAHIPGAVYFDVDAVSDHSNPLPHMFPSADQFGRDVGALGISNGDTVVVYDAGGWVAAPRVWWMFLSYGHRDVRILNGGLKKWRAEGRAVETGEVAAKPATFNASYDAKRVRSIEAMIANVASRAEQVIDARAADRFEGRAVEPRPGIRAGHIVRCRDRHDEAARRVEESFCRRWRRYGEADRDQLRLGCFGGGADARALWARRREHCAL